MSKLYLEWVEEKSKDWRVVTVKDEAGKITTDVSVNRTNKKGEVFPNFDNITPGADIEGELWSSPAGKWYLFAPKPASQSFANKPVWAKKDNNITKAMDRKEESIATFQASKEDGIKMAGAARDATLMVTTFYASTGLSDQEIKAKWNEWRSWLLDAGNQPF